MPGLRVARRAPLPEREPLPEEERDLEPELPLLSLSLRG